MRRSQRLIASAVLISLCGVLAGCSSSVSNWDPTDLLDFLDTKKKLPGKREEVFPSGVPGIEQGVPKELYKDNVEREQQQQQEAGVAPAAAAPPPVEAKPKAAKRSRTKGAPAGAEATPAEDGSAAAAPAAPKPKRLVHRRATSLPKDEPAQQQPQPAQQQQQPAQQQTQPATSPFPAPLPSGSFSR